MKNLKIKLLAAALCVGMLTGCGSGAAATSAASAAPAAPSSSAAIAVPTPEPTPEPVVIPIDFEEWKGINEDVYAWINVPGTNIDYPVLQSGEGVDPDYYLEYCIDRTRGRPGCIYSETNYNPDPFNDIVTILYGHDMWTDDTYFHQLHLLEDPDFFEENRQVIIYTPDEIRNYTIFAVFNYDDRHLMMSNYGFTMNFHKTNFLEEVYSIRDMKAIIDESMKERVMDESSRILILSTCNQISPYQRYLVLAVLD